MSKRGLSRIFLLGWLVCAIAGKAFEQGVYEAWVARNSEPGNSDYFANALALDTSCNAKTGCSYVTVGEVTADPCQTVEVPVTLIAFRDIGGFSFCIEFRNTDLTVISARRGDGIDDVDSLNGRYKWHYFTYRLNPTTDPNKYKICVIGIGKVYSSYPGMCITGNGQPCVLSYIKFYLACNELLRCCDSHLDFQWDPSTCLENTLVDCTGDTLFVSDDDTLYNVDSCGLGQNMPCVHFDNGRLTFRCILGDMNASGTISLGDIVHLVNYYFDKDGPGCLGSDPGNCWTPDPFCRGDVNQSGTITIGDIVHLVNYIFDKDRLPCLGSNPGNCWTPEANGACCLAVP